MALRFTNPATTLSCRFFYPERVFVIFCVDPSVGFWLYVTFLAAKQSILSWAPDKY